MKKNLCIGTGALMAGLLLTALTAAAQPQPKTWSITPKVGVAVSSVTGHPGATVGMVYARPADVPNPGGAPIQVTSSYGTDRTTERLGLVVGAEAQYQFSPKWGLTLGALYSRQGVNFKGFDTYDSDLKATVSVHGLSLALDYVSVPVLANFYIYKGLAVKAGVQPAFCVDKKQKGKLTLTGNTPDGMYVAGTEKPSILSLDMSIPMGLSYEVSHVVIDLRYNLGVTNIAGGDWVPSKPTFRNSSFALTVGYRIGL